MSVLYMLLISAVGFLFGFGMALYWVAWKQLKIVALKRLELEGAALPHKQATAPANPPKRESQSV